jgi:hypothetical protein
MFQAQHSGLPERISRVNPAAILVHIHNQQILMGDAEVLTEHHERIPAIQDIVEASKQNHLLIRQPVDPVFTQPAPWDSTDSV